MPVVIVDGQEIEIGADERLNCIEAARRAGKEIPHYCWHPGLSVVASCRMCLIETGQRDAATGKVSMVPKLVPGCQPPVKDGTVIVTESDLVKESRARVEEALLIDHPIDCPICDKAGECLLQDYHFEHGQAERRADLHAFKDHVFEALGTEAVQNPYPLSLPIVLVFISDLRALHDHILFLIGKQRTATADT